MISIKIRPLSELHYPVCLGSGTFTVQLDGSAAGAGHLNWSPKSLTGEEGSIETKAKVISSNPTGAVSISRLQNPGDTLHPQT